MASSCVRPEIVAVRDASSCQYTVSRVISPRPATVRHRALDATDGYDVAPHAGAGLGRAELDGHAGVVVAQEQLHRPVLGEVLPGAR